MFNFKKQYDDPGLKFVCMADGMLDIEEVIPKKSVSYIPSWWRETPRKSFNSNFTVKACPSFVDYFSQGFILPSWSDVSLHYESSVDMWSANQAASSIHDGQYSWDIHTNDQYMDHVKSRFQGVEPTIVFKGNSPWRIITNPGWSVLQLPLFYHFNNDFAAMPGIIDTDIEHEVNVQMLYFGNGKEINIKRGQPLVQYIPFKRKKNIEIDVEYLSNETQKKINKQKATMGTKFLGSGAYRLAQKERDEGIVDYDV